MLRQEWDVSALVAHVTTGNLLFAAALRGQALPDLTRMLALHLRDPARAGRRRAMTSRLSRFPTPCSS